MTQVQAIGYAPLVVGLSGRAGSGKTTAARFLSSHFNIPRRPFAYPLKSMVAALGISEEVLDGPSAVKEMATERLNGHTVRYALQTLGTEWGRNLMGEDFWVRQWLAGLDELPGGIADDVRFANEVNAVRSRGGVVIRVERDGAGVRGPDAAHVSEQVDLLAWDHVVPNNGSIEDFQARLLSVTRSVAISSGRLVLPVAGRFSA